MTSSFLVVALVFAFWRQRVPVESKEVGGGTPRGSNASVASYCEFETFQPSCAAGEVIVMLSALYGRMHLGRCVEESLGHLGCSADVLEVADRKCSGRRSCSVVIPDADFNARKQCNKELKMYLDASYACQRVAVDDGSCSVLLTSSSSSSSSSSSPAASSSSSAPLAIPSSSKHGCGSSSTHPWVVEAVPGQRIDVTVVDFLPSNDHDHDPSIGEGTERQQRPREPQVPRAVVVDRAGGGNVTVWRRRRREEEEDGEEEEEEEREREVMRSKGNVLEVFVSASETKNEEQFEFLLRFEAVGCADLRSSSDSWIVRNDDEVTVGCHSSRQTWHLKCRRQRWTGVVGNCSAANAQATAKKEALHNYNISNLPHALAIGTVAGIALTLCLLIVSIGFVVSRRLAKQDRLRSLAKAALRYDDDDDVNSDDDIVQAYYVTGKPETRHQPTGTTTADPSTYSHVWELPLPEPGIGEGEIDPSGTGGPIWGDPALAPTLAGAEDKQGAACPRSDQTRYYILDRGTTTGTPVGGSFPSSVGSPRC